MSFLLQGLDMAVRIMISLVIFVAIGVWLIMDDQEMVDYLNRYPSTGEEATLS